MSAPPDAAPRRARPARSALAGARAIAAAAILIGGAEPALGAEKQPPAEPLDLNTATVQELMGLPGVGRRKAEAIAAHRARRPFRSVDEIVRVRGIGRAVGRRLRPHLRVSPPAAPAPASP